MRRLLVFVSVTVIALVLVTRGFFVNAHAWLLRAQGTQQAQTGMNFQPILTGTTGSIGGSALLVGASASGTVSVPGAQPGMTCDATPVDGTDFAGLGATVSCTVTASGTVTVRVMAVIALTPTSKTYNVRVIQ